jgi:hypothetical protein
MNDRWQRETTEATMSALFAHAAEQMKDEHDKKVLDGLHKLIKQAEHDLYDPKPRYMDAFFFPNKANI